MSSLIDDLILGNFFSNIPIIFLVSSTDKVVCVTYATGLLNSSILRSLAFFSVSISFILPSGSYPIVPITSGCPLCPTRITW